MLRYSNRRMPVEAKAIMFVDGENLVARFQDMLASGMRQSPDVVHEKDCFVWSPAVGTIAYASTLRVNYYATVVGDQVRIDDVRARLGSMKTRTSLVREPVVWAKAIPRLYKKENKSQKSRLLDVEIVIDVVKALHEYDVDSILLLSGDGDFLSLVEEITRRSSKHLQLAAFSSGLSKDLPSAVDAFTLLDNMFFGG